MLLSSPTISDLETCLEEVSDWFFLALDFDLNINITVLFLIKKKMVVVFSEQACSTSLYNLNVRIFLYAEN